MNRKDRRAAKALSRRGNKSDGVQIVAVSAHESAANRTRDAVSESLCDAIHEAGHAVAFLLAYRALGRDYRPFHRVLIRRDISKPYIDDRGRERQIRGMVEGPDIYSTLTGPSVYELSIQQGMSELTAIMLATMQWDIVISLAGPFAEAVIVGDWTKTHMSWTAYFYCGGRDDLAHAETVLDQYRVATKRRCGLTRFEHRTRELVLSAWPAIEVLAAALLEAEVMEYDEVAAIVLPLLPKP
jgi:hypothetical protein